MTEVTQADPWECFSDASYYDMWCVRLKTDRTFGAGIHVLRQEEAEHLRDFLNARTTAEAAKDARIKELEAENARLREALWLFREFALRNATQWKVGANHHHPIYPMIAELVGEMGGITSGPAWRFVQPDNAAALQENDNAG